MFYPSRKYLDQSIDGEKVPSPFGYAIAGTASEPFQIVPYTGGIGADDTAALVFPGNFR